MPFTVTPNVRIGRDDSGTARHVLHLQEPYMPAGAVALTPRSLAGAYVQDVAGLYDLDPTWLSTLQEAVGHAVKREGSQVRFRESKKLLNTTVVTYQQTYLGLPVWGAHLDVRTHDAPMRVTSSTSFAHHDVEAAAPSRGARFVPGKPGTQALLRRVLAAAKGRVVKVTAERLIVYRYEAHERFDPESRPAGPQIERARATRTRSARQAAPPVGVPTLPLPNVPKSIGDGRHCVVNEVLFTTALGPWKQLHWRAFVEVETGAVLYLRALVTHAFGNVFTRDPISATGNAALTPTSPATTLDPITSVVTLPGLTPPPAGGPQALAGEYVQVGELSSPTVAAPTATLPSGNFSRSCVTDDFSAVNVYYTCDLFFRTMQSMGIDVATYFTDTTFPLTVDHRDASLGTVNARGYGNATGDGAGGMGFNLLHAASTLSISAEPRIAWHEFGHELLFEHVGGPNFGFAHSAGDSLGVIMLDPDSLAPDRFLTFPFCPAIVRRHDRPVSGGWGWFGSQWDAAYNGEQVLSTTLFRLYRSTGGDAGDVTQRRLAARYTSYLVIQGCGALTTTTSDPDVYASAMMEADLGTTDFEGIPGGAVHKVVRWAFEKQGLYRAAGAPTTDEGQPPDVDVYIDDGRAGEYQYQGNFWNTTAIWNRLSGGASGTESDHETPVVGQVNYVFVRVRNRGTQTATGVTVRAYHCVPATGLVWPDDWQESPTGARAAANIPSGGDVIVGPFEWTPEVIGHECLLTTVSADGDRANTDPASTSPAAAGPIPHWRLVPFDNNIAQRNVAPVPGGGGASGLRAAFERRRFFARNPYPRPLRIELRPVLPDVLVKRGYELRFVSAGGHAFTLGPRASREVVMQLKPGDAFGPGDIGGNTRIEVEVLGDGMLIGGMSYQLDPRLKTPPRETPGGVPNGGKCRDEASALLDCLDVPHGKVKRVRVSRVVVNVDLEEDCD
jgi:hypothetical protein